MNSFILGFKSRWNELGIGLFVNYSILLSMTHAENNGRGCSDISTYKALIEYYINDHDSITLNQMSNSMVCTLHDKKKTYNCNKLFL